VTERLNVIYELLGQPGTVKIVDERQSDHCVSFLWSNEKVIDTQLFDHTKVFRCWDDDSERVASEPIESDGGTSFGMCFHV
jgi:hypothetical protein